MKHLQLVDEFLAYGCEYVSRRHGPIGLDADEELGDVRMPD
jgi:hypothetical protein